MNPPGAGQGFEGASFAQVQTQWARLLLGSLVEAGLHHAVISPGSRSTPLVAAALKTPGLTLHRVIDERSAAFFALGLARASGLPAVLICTSGTAPAHYLPAVIEAAHARVPFLVLSADRPLEQVWVGAAQTIDQTRLFGSFALAAWDLGIPEPDTLCFRTLRRRAHDAVFLAMQRRGVVHLNARARKPLEPVESVSPPEQRLEAFVTRLLTREPSSCIPPRRSLIRHGAEDLELGSFGGGFLPVEQSLGRLSRVLVVIGPLLPLDVQDVPHLLGTLKGYSLPVLLEATGQLTWCGSPLPYNVFPRFEHLLRVPELRDALRPELIIQLGGTPTSAALEPWFQTLADGEPPVMRVVLTDGLEADPSSSGERWVRPDGLSLELFLRLAIETLGGAWVSLEKMGYLQRWYEAYGASEAALASLLALPPVGSAWSEAQYVDQLLRCWHTVPHADLLLGNSLLLREVELYAGAGEEVQDHAGAEPDGPAEHRVYFQRGVNGIDGLIAQACGIAGASGRPLLVLLGDVTATHDLGSLVLAGQCRSPVVIVVMDNGGGRIFDLLPVAENPALAQAQDWWTSPIQVDRPKVAQACGAEGIRIETPEALLPALEKALKRPGLTLLEVPVAVGQVRSFSAEVRRVTRDAVLSALQKEDL